MPQEWVPTIHLEIVILLAIGSALATVLGYFSEKIRLSPILGYLLAGYLIGPYSPGFVADAQLSEQLAEIGVILMMFWVGLHVTWQKLVDVKSISLTGAIGQTLVSTIAGSAVMVALGWSLEAALVIGFSLGIASTVVLVRVLAENQLQHTRSGYIALSWLIFEDFLAVFALLLLPTLAIVNNGLNLQWDWVLLELLVILAKFIIWVALLVTIGKKLISFLLHKVNNSRTTELFVLAVLAITFSITLISAQFTGTSIALGAFIAGMILGQTTLQNQISTNLMSLRDAFVVFFFLSIGMLFNPLAIVNHFSLFLSALGIVLVVKPLVAWAILRAWKSTNRIAVTVAVSLAQIGEFSFIIVEEAARLKIIPDDGFDIIVCVAFISLAINPFLITLLRPGERR